MKKLKLLALLSALMLCSCGNGEKPRTYTFDVVEYHTAYITSEVQEKTYEPRIAFCESGINYAYVEVPQDYNSDKIELIYTGYKIRYLINSGRKSVSNEGWELYK